MVFRASADIKLSPGFNTKKKQTRWRLIQVDQTWRGGWKNLVVELARPVRSLEKFTHSVFGENE